MSVKLMSKVWDCDLDHSTQTILLSLADHAKDDGTDVYPSVGYTAWKTGYSVRQVQRIILDLITNGILILVERPYRGRPTEYRINIEAARQKEAYSPRSWVTKREPRSAAATKRWGDRLSPQRTGPTGDILTPQDVSPQHAGSDISSPQEGQVGMTFHSERSDIPQPNGVTSSAITGDKNRVTGDKAVSQEPLNHQEPSGLEALECRTHPPTPFDHEGGGGIIWTQVRACLKQELADFSLRASRFAHLPYDFDEMFRDTWQVETREGGIVVIGSDNRALTAEGLRKYERRLKLIARRLFNLDMQFTTAQGIVAGESVGVSGAR